VPSKKGKLPFVLGHMYGTDIKVGMRLGKDKRPELRAERQGDIPRIRQVASDAATRGESSVFVFEQRAESPPQREMSRFLCKMALEALYQRFAADPELIALLIDEPHYDRIRDFARRGNEALIWPYRERPIFPEETEMRHPTTGKWVQFGFGYDLFMTRSRETYFAFCYYGTEYVLNVGGPSLLGFDQWLAEFSDASPFLLRHKRCLFSNAMVSLHPRLIEGPVETAALDFDRALLLGAS